MAWSRSHWQHLEEAVGAKVARARSEAEAWRCVVRASRHVLRSFSSSFFLVTRFLPPGKRAEVEVIYAAVRYPDEVVDTFPMPVREQTAILDRWEKSYLEALKAEGVRARAGEGISWILAGFAEVVARRRIPPVHYLAFLNAMRRDARPEPFATTERLIEDYVYGSAVVVGYFLTHVYGNGPHSSLEEALICARELGIALQFTNFARDVFDDFLRGRQYLPLELLEAEGLNAADCLRPENDAALRRTVRALAAKAEMGYEYARRNLGAFAPDSRTAIGACIEVYQELNRRFLRGDAPVRMRVSLSAAEKFRVLPPDKYWRVPLAYAGFL